MVDSRASDGAVAKTKSSASAGNQNPALRSSNFSPSHPSFKEKREVLYLTALAFCWFCA
jgi:hypothetical protein